MAASRYLGRANLAVALRSFMAEGVWGTSPHLIPHFALHSASGTISLALGSHGPNLGVGGGLHAAAEGFLTALTWLSTGVVPGVWLVLTGWSPELVPDPSGNAPASWRMPGAGAGPGGRRASRPARPAFRAVFGRIATDARARRRDSGVGWPSSSGRPGGAIAAGRSRPMRAGGCASSWLNGSDDPRMRRYGND